MERFNTTIPHVERNLKLPLSFVQRRLWYLSQMDGGSEVNHISFGLQMNGELHRNALQGALDRLLERHESLRTTFPCIDGEPVQRIAIAGRSQFQLKEHDLCGQPDIEHELKRLSMEEAVAPFDLENGPLIRGG